MVVQNVHWIHTYILHTCIYCICICMFSDNQIKWFVSSPFTFFIPFHSIMPYMCLVTSITGIGKCWCSYFYVSLRYSRRFFGHIFIFMFKQKLIDIGCSNVSNICKLNYHFLFSPVNVPRPLLIIIIILHFTFISS